MNATAETSRQRTARLRKAIHAADEKLAAAIRAERRIDVAFGCIQSQDDATQFLADNDWNAAHDAITAARAELQQAEREYSSRNIDSNTLALIAANID